MDLTRAFGTTYYSSAESLPNLILSKELLSKKNARNAKLAKSKEAPNFYTMHPVGMDIIQEAKKAVEVNHQSLFGCRGGSSPDEDASIPEGQNDF
jgi:hypothetical protein